MTDSNETTSVTEGTVCSSDSDRVFRESMVKGARLWMPRALERARQAGDHADVPVGAVIVRDGEVLGEAENQVEEAGDPTAHAEVVALRRACKSVGSKWLSEAVMYVTLEPCAMCAGALILGRLRGLVFGAADSKTGAVRSRFALLEDPRANHQLIVVGGIDADACSEELSGFFRQLRAKPRADNQ